MPHSKLQILNDAPLQDNRMRVCSTHLQTLLLAWLMEITFNGGTGNPYKLHQFTDVQTHRVDIEIYKFKSFCRLTYST